MSSRVQQLHQAGQAVWLDFVEREFLSSGGLRSLITDDGLTGVTSNPSIFEKAMGAGAAYDRGFTEAFTQPDMTVTEAYETQAIRDIRTAADELHSVFDATSRRDGYISLEVSPYLALDSAATIAEAHRLWKAVDRPNLMIKVPGTEAGTRAVRVLIEDGLNVNVTLIFSENSYEAIAEAYFAGLEARVAKGLPIDGVASVASFFVSRIDSRIDAAIDARLASGDPLADALRAVRGKTAIANAKVAYAGYRTLVKGARWQALAALGAMSQRLLWASTGTKDPAYPDTLYVDALIGADTVNTMPPRTMDAFRDHGTIGMSLLDDVPGARDLLDEVKRLGLDLAAVTKSLVEDGVQQFADAFDQLLGVVAAKRTMVLGPTLNCMTSTLPGPLKAVVDARLDQARRAAWTRRLWQGDASLWTAKDEARWVGWLGAGSIEPDVLRRLETLTAEVRTYKDAVLLGMGGSSLGPEVLSLILGSTEGHPRFHVLDTSDPEQIARVASAIDPARSLFIVSSKSGSTMEPELLRAFFAGLPGVSLGQFIAVTDPGSRLEAQARADGFAQVILGNPEIGGRYSVLSAFGLVPAAVMGIDVPAFLAATRTMVHACAADVPPTENPGVRLGVILGEAAKMGRDKLTIVPSPALAPFGAWLEQLIAESTGKRGTGIVPVNLEPIVSPEHYGPDRLFVHIRLAGDSDRELATHIDRLRDAGHPVIVVTLARPDMLGQEFFRWEMATAIAGAVLGIDPFDQPDVEDAKRATRALVDAYEHSGVLAIERPLFEDETISIFGPGHRGNAGEGAEGLMRAHLALLRPGDYLGLLAYVERAPEQEAALARMRKAILRQKAVATVAGFGPRFLHSTGQAYKGGPATGVFIEITRDTQNDLAIPGRRASFATVQFAQALGDLDVLAQRRQRVLRVHLKNGDLRHLEALIDGALAARQQEIL